MDIMYGGPGEVDEIRCVNCEKDFDLKVRTPYELPCGHTGKKTGALIFL